MADAALAELILKYLVDIARGECALTDESILELADSDPTRAQILSAILMLHETIVFQKQDLVASAAASARLEESAARADDLARSNAELERALDELKRTQATLIRAGKHATAGQLAAGVAHEINNPLSAVLGLSALLREDLAGAPGVGDALPHLGKHLQLIHEGAQRCKVIVHNLLAFSRQTSGELIPVSVAEVIDVSIALVELNVRHRRVEITRSVPPDLVVLGDSGELEQILTNLLLNAVDALLVAPASICVRAYQMTPKTAAIEVADTGPGIDERNLPRIFEPFFTTKPVGKGTGLGLSIVHGLVEKHGGTIAVATSPAGTTFRVELPLQ